MRDLSSLRHGTSLPVLDWDQLASMMNQPASAHSNDIFSPLQPVSSTQQLWLEQALSMW